MKITNHKKYYLPGSDKRFIHLATIRDGLDDYLCFRESDTFFNIRRVRDPFPDVPQVYIERLIYVPIYKQNEEYSFTIKLERIEPYAEWKELAIYLLQEEIIREHDLMRGYSDVIAEFKLRQGKEILDANS